MTGQYIPSNICEYSTHFLNIDENELLFQNLKQGFHNNDTIIWLYTNYPKIIHKNIDIIYFCFREQEEDYLKLSVKEFSQKIQSINYQFINNRYEEMTRYIKDGYSIEYIYKKSECMPNICLFEVFWIHLCSRIANLREWLRYLSVTDSFEKQKLQQDFILFLKLQELIFDENNHDIFYNNKGIKLCKDFGII